MAESYGSYMLFDDGGINKFSDGAVESEEIREVGSSFYGRELGSGVDLRRSHVGFHNVHSGDVRKTNGIP